MTNTINSTTSPLDAVTCFLMAKSVYQWNSCSWAYSWTRKIFWETLPDRIPNLEAHLPALIFAVRNETDDGVMDKVSSHPLPATLSTEAVGWRAGLIAAWEKQLKKACDGFNETRSQDWMRKGMVSLRGLTELERCGMPPGVTCPSVLPILLKEARRVHADFVPPGTPPWSWKVYEQLRCLAALSAWRPGPNVIPDPAVLNEWADFWLELYQQENWCVGEKQPNDVIVLKGIAAKALLNLMETDGKEAPKLPAGMESLLLESLMRAAEVGGTERPAPYAYDSDTYQLGWLSWQPRDVTRFPLDTLAELPKSLLKRFRLSCQNICQNTYNRWCEQAKREMERITNPLLTELIKWDRAGALAACGVDLLPSVVTELDDYLDKFHGDRALWNEHLLISHEVCRWLIRHEVANVKEGRELLQKLESHWIIKCNSHEHNPDSLSVAWNGRIQLQRAGLATEDPATFQESLIEAINYDLRGEIQMVLSIWKPGEDTPIMRRRAWERCWKEKLMSWYVDRSIRNASISAAVALLQPDPTNNLIGQREKLLDTLTLLPESLYLQLSLSVTDITVLMGELSPRNPNAAADANPNRDWQFRPDETRFRIPTEPAVPPSTPAPVQADCPDRTAQRIARSKPQRGRYS